MKIEQTKIYIADDGRKFTSQEECEEYEKKQNILKPLPVYLIAHSPDLTEGRGYYGRSLVVVGKAGYCEPLTLATALAMKRFGSPVTDLYGTPIPNWTIKLLDTSKKSAEDYLSSMTGYVGDQRPAATGFVITDDDDTATAYHRFTKVAPMELR